MNKLALKCGDIHEGMILADASYVKQRTQYPEAQ